MTPFFMSNDFESYLTAEKRFSQHTVVAYMKDISQFMEFAYLKKDKEIKEVDANLVRGWMISLLDSGASNRSVNRKMSSLRRYFKWLKQLEIVDENPLKLVKTPKSEKRLPSFVKEKQLEEEQLVDVFSNDFSGIRDRLMFEFFYQTGIRSSELVGLLDVNVQRDSIKVLGKRSKERMIPISAELYELSSIYRRLRAEMDVDHPYFFVLNSGKKLYPKFVYRKINSYLVRATDVEKKSPHVLRHTFATHMLNSGAGLEVLKELLGHANLSATQIYTHNSFAELTAIYSRSHPREKKK